MGGTQPGGEISRARQPGGAMHERTRAARALRAAAVAACALHLALPAAGEAQQPPASDAPPSAAGFAAAPTASVLDLALFGGFLTPLSDLTSSDQSFATAITAAPLVGASATWWPAARWGIAAEVAYAPADLHVRPTDFPGAVPTELGAARWTAGSVNVVHRLLPSGAAALVEPYAAVGAGLRHLSVDEIAEPEVSDATDPVGSVAAGLGLRFAPRLVIRAELRNRISAYEAPRTGESRLQNDITVTLGIGARVR